MKKISVDPTSESYWTRLRVSKTVYSFIYPETKKLLGALWQSRPFALYERAYTKKQDRMHEPFMRTWKKWAAPIVDFAAEDFPFSYPCAGSTEAIRESLASYATQSRAQGLQPRIHVFEGEYEGYAAYARSYHIQVITHPRRAHLAIQDFHRHDKFYVSQPSAIDGNVWTEFPDFVHWMQTHCPTVGLAVDLCYVGAVAKPFTVNLRSPNIEKIFFSLSKLFGVYYHRIGGCWSRQELPGLFANKWFKNLFSLTLGTKLMKKFSVYHLPRKYAHYQSLAVAHLQTKTQLPWLASDAVMLAYCAAGAPTSFLNRIPYGRLQRACLTPYIDKKMQPRRRRIKRKRKR